VEGNGMEVPSDTPYSEQPWPQVERNHAAMITRLDDYVGRIMKKLREVNLDDNTIVFFTSDNGPHQEGGADPKFFKSAGPLRGIKRDLYEGGIRVPMIARWPGKVKAGATSDQVWAFWDVLPTLAELGGANAPAGLDGISMAPALLDQKQIDHAPLYWEFHERGFSQAVRVDNWKAVRKGPKTALELYDLSKDISEQQNVVDKNVGIAARFEAYLTTARTESARFPVRENQKKGKRQ
jgi:arylsulfatase A-like enzyme